MRTEVIERLVGWITARSGTVRLAIDGPDTAGKTTLAAGLAGVIEAGGRPVIRASIDGFHRPATERYRQGKLSPAGYYEDSFDLDALRTVLLDPLSPGGNRRYRTAVFDHVADEAVREPELVAPDDVALVFDGVFLLRPELAGLWDLTLYLEVAEEEIVRRALIRDGAQMGGGVRNRYEHRYLPAQRRYRATVCPTEIADVVIDNTDPDDPVETKAPWL
jgi:uridine kinase